MYVYIYIYCVIGTNKAPCWKLSRTQFKTTLLFHVVLFPLFFFFFVLGFIFLLDSCCFMFFSNAVTSFPLFLFLLQNNKSFVLQFFHWVAVFIFSPSSIASSLLCHEMLSFTWPRIKPMLHRCGGSQQLKRHCIALPASTWYHIESCTHAVQNDYGFLIQKFILITFFIVAVKWER